MAYSTQRVVSDGSLVLLSVSIGYLERAHIKVFFDNVENDTLWDWVGSTDNQIAFAPAVPNGVEVLVARRTDLSAPYHVFSQGAQFTAGSLDEDIAQILYIAQEATEQSLTAEFFQDVNMHGFKLTNIADAVDPQDAMTLGQATETIQPYVDASAAYAAAASSSATTATTKAGEASSSATQAANSAASLPNVVVAGPSKVVISNATATAWEYKTYQEVVEEVDTSYRGSEQIGHISSGVGAVATTVQEKLRELVSVKDFGDADGVGSITLNVPTQYATIQEALNWLASKTIASGSTVVIQVADGTYSLSSGIYINHPQGSQIRLIGNETTPDNCVITVSGAPTFDALAVGNGNKLGYLNGFYFTLSNKAGLANNFTAILAYSGAEIICGPKIKTNNWYYGIAARDGSFVSCEGANVDNSGDVGIWAMSGSTINARGATSSNASDQVNNWGWGFEAEYGSAIDCSYATATGCRIGGIGSLSNSNVRALNSNTSGNIGSGFYARDGATIECHNSVTNNNGGYGVEEIGASRILGNNLTLTGNTLGGIKPIAILDNSQLGARITPNTSSPLRVDAAGAGNSVYFHTHGGLQSEVRDAIGAVNHPFLTGNVAGQPAIIGADGSDSVIDIFLLPKGAGSYVRIGAGFSTNVLTPNGNIGIKIGDGSLVYIPVYKP